MLTPEDLKNLNVLVSVGAKAFSAEKPLQESATIQAVAVALLEKLEKLVPSEKVE
jgi:hypothetical protein